MEQSVCLLYDIITFGRRFCLHFTNVKLKMSFVTYSFGCVNCESGTVTCFESSQTDYCMIKLCVTKTNKSFKTWLGAYHICLKSGLLKIQLV